MEVKVIKIGERVRVDAVYTQFTSMFNSIFSYVGQIGVVERINREGGAIGIRFIDGELWFYPQCVLTKMCDVDKHVPIDNIRPSKKLFVGKVLSRIRYHICIREIEEYTDVNTNGLLADIDSVVFLAGKYVKVLDENYIASFVKRNTVHTFVGVEYHGEKYYLPIHSLYSNEPIYKPRKIQYGI